MSSAAVSVDALSLAISAGVPAVLWGAPGTGKSSAVMAMAEAAGTPCEVVIASIREPSDFAGLPIGEQDPIIGPASAEAQMTLPGEPMPFLFDFKRFITTRCSEYFFMPSLTALRGIAAKKY